MRCDENAMRFRTRVGHPAQRGRILRRVCQQVNLCCGVSKMSVKTLQELLVDELKDLYSAEKQITTALPKLAKATTSPELKAALESHLQETIGQIDRLDQVFDLLDLPHKAKLCHGMQGVLEEGSEVLEDVEKSDLRDAALIGACQRVEHYE